MKILVVEDDPIQAMILEKILIQAGYSVVVAENGAVALQCLEKETFNIIVTDWMMPCMDGIELIKKVRERVRPRPMIVMSTVLEDKDARIQAIQSGADGYIHKPYKKNELLEELKIWEIMLVGND